MKTVTRDGETIAYTTSSGAGSRAVAFAHNLMCDHEVFTGVKDEIAREHRVVALDLRGHGGSTAHAPYEIADAAADLSAILDAEGIREVVVVGLSVGASMALELFRARDARVRGAVLLAPCGQAATRRERVRDSLLAAAVRTVGLRGELATQTARMLFGETFRARAPETVRAWENKVRALSAPFAAHAVGAWSRRRGVLGDLAALDVPVTVVVGDEDARCPPADGEAVHHAIHGARLVRLAETGHTMSVERPDAVLEAIRDVCERAVFRE